MSSLSTALTTIRRSPYQSLSLLIVVSITVFVGYCLSFFLIGAQMVLFDLETQPQVIAFFTLGTEEQSIFDTEKQMQSMSEVKQTKVITQDQALAIYQEENKDDPLLLELVTANILPASIEVQPTSLNSLPVVKQKLEQAPGVEEVVYPEDLIAVIQRWIWSLRVGGLVGVAVLGVQFFLTIFVVIGLKAASQKHSFSIARLLGASKGFVKRPLIAEGGVFGVIASALSWVLACALFAAVSPQLQSLGIPTQDMMQPVILGAQFLIGTVVTVSLGALAGYVAGTRLLHTS